ncbi:hypothetical protein O3M35_006915 [Rhynocoris fuscipes]|uniref:Myb-like domain-containing protein n=1 Tax=Rhynocoris fuscipes TaxID=488301 RepID=A0AAW1DME9_9HEMI
MNETKLSEIEEEVINFLEISRNRSTDILNETNSINNNNNNGDGKEISNLERLQNEQENSREISDYRCNVALNGIYWDRDSIAANDICAPSPGYSVNLNQSQHLSDINNDYIKENMTSLNFNCNLNAKINQLNNNFNLENVCEQKLINDGLNENKSSKNSIETTNENYLENIPFHFNDSENENNVEECSETDVENFAEYFENERLENCIECIRENDENSFSGSGNSDREEHENDIEEIIVKEKLTKIDLKKENVGYCGRIDYLKRLSLNCLMRNTLYDLEHSLLKLIESSLTPELGMKSVKVHTQYRNRKFYLKCLTPYFKDKRGIAFAPYYREDILSDNLKNIYDYTYEAQIYDVYCAIKQHFEDNTSSNNVGEEITVKKNKREGRKGRRKTNYETEYTEIDFDSMESEFIKFLKTYKSHDSLNIFDTEIDWLKISSMQCLQGMNSEECKKIWHMVLKPLIQLGGWSAEESGKVLDIAGKYNYRSWDRIAEELGSGRDRVSVLLSCDE